MLGNNLKKSIHLKMISNSGCQSLVPALCELENSLSQKLELEETGDHPTWDPGPAERD